MKKILLKAVFVSLSLILSLSLFTPVAMAATPAEIAATIDEGLVWLASQQNATTGQWGTANTVAHTALAVLKFEHHAVFGLGISPFDPAYAYRTNVEKGLNYLFSQAKTEGPVPLTAPADPGPGNTCDPDLDGGIIIYQNSGERMYEHGAAMMAIAACNDPLRVVNVAGSIVNTWTYQAVLQDMVDLTAWAQMDPVTGNYRGGWRYAPNQGSSDNSVSGYPTLGLGYAQAPPPWGFGLTVPQFVKTELSFWINYIQNDGSGGSGYDTPSTWVNMYKTGNLLYEMALVGDTPATPRVQAAVNYLVNNWNAAYTAGSFTDPGWKGPVTYSHYHAIFAMMKGLEALGIALIGGIDWFDEFSDQIVAEQLANGSWPANSSYGGTSVTETAWAMLTMERAVPPPNLILTPPTSFNYVGSSHTLTATLVDDTGAPIGGETITFTVIAGPHAGQSGTGDTNASGQATWSYTGTIVGEDTIRASGGGVTSNTAKKTWSIAQYVGGTVYPINVIGLMAPWLVLLVFVTAGTVFTVKRRCSKG